MSKWVKIVGSSNGKKNLDSWITNDQLARKIVFNLNLVRIFHSIEKKKYLLQYLLIHHFNQFIKFYIYLTFGE